MFVSEAGQTVKVNMASIGFGQAPSVMEALLGSCVGVAIWDRANKTGGLAHVVLPDSRGKPCSPGKYADTAVPELRRRLIAMAHCPVRLSAKIAGGATMFGRRAENDIGEMNHQAVLAYLRQYHIPVMAEHIGGGRGRNIRFSLEDGSVEVYVGRTLITTI